MKWLLSIVFIAAAATLAALSPCSQPSEGAPPAPRATDAGGVPEKAPSAEGSEKPPSGNGSGREWIPVGCSELLRRGPGGPDGPAPAEKAWLDDEDIWKHAGAAATLDDCELFEADRSKLPYPRLHWEGCGPGCERADLTQGYGDPRILRFRSRPPLAVLGAARGGAARPYLLLLQSERGAAGAHRFRDVFRLIDLESGRTKHALQVRTNGPCRASRRLNDNPFQLAVSEEVNAQLGRLTWDERAGESIWSPPLRGALPSHCLPPLEDGEGDAAFFCRDSVHAPPAPDASELEKVADLPQLHYVDHGVEDGGPVSDFRLERSVVRSPSRP